MANRYQRMPDSFLRSQFAHAPDGVLNAELLDYLTRWIRDRRSRWSQ